MRRLRGARARLVMLIVGNAALLVMFLASVVVAALGRAQASGLATAAASLEAQGQTYLRLLVDQNATVNNRELIADALAGAQLARLAASADAARLGDPAFRFQAIAGGQQAALPGAATTIYLPAGVSPEAARADLRSGALLDLALPTQHESVRNITAISYVGASGLIQTYPAIDLSSERPPHGAELLGRLAPGRSVPVWLDPWPEPGSPEPAVSLATPVLGADGELRGAIVIDISLAFVARNLETLLPTAHSAAFLLDQRRTLLAATPEALRHLAPAGADPGAALTLAATDSPSLGQALQAMFVNPEQAPRLRVRVEPVMLGGRRFFLAYAPLPEPGWALGLLTPSDELTGSAADVEAAIVSTTASVVPTLLGSALAVLLLSLAASLYATRRLLAPIADLLRGTQAVAAGDLSVTIPVAGDEEFGALASSFNQMTAELAGSRRQLEGWNQELERQVHDRTAELEQASKAAEQAQHVAEDANLMKSRFLATMSHELRTPLNAIINFTSFLPRYGEFNERQSDLQQRVVSNARHLLGLINDILDLSKIESGRMELHREPMNLHHILYGVMSTATVLTREKGLSLTLEAPEQLPPVSVDAGRIRQVLLNLLANAAKFTQQGGITVRVSVGEELLVAVADTGIGVAPEHFDLIFGEFQQVQNDLTRSYEGTGLGLPISKRLVEMHGGRMWLESQPGAGSTFSFTLPLLPPAAPPPSAPAEADEPAPAAAPSADPNRPDIAVIDDDADARHAFEVILGEAGYRVRSIGQSPQAIAELRAAPPRLIILDLLMPQMSGWEVLAALREQPELASLPVVICSIHDQTTLRGMFGVQAHLVKPVPEPALLDEIKRWIRPAATVLVADDDSGSRGVVRHSLSERGYRVLEAADGAGALALIPAARPDLVILDLLMPGTDGFAVLEALRANPETVAIPVIILSAKDLSAAERQWLAERSQRFFEKSQLSSASFLSHIDQLLHRGGHDEPAPS
ncbi:MAG TPA: response regulator [Herpetosiphonaceae bacterium]